MSDEEIIEVNPEEVDEEEALFLDDDIDLGDELGEEEDLGITFSAED